MDPHVSVHAIQRYQERVADVPVEIVIARLSSPIIRQAIAFGACTVILGTGHRVVIKGDTIVSGLALVLPRQKEDTAIAAVKLDAYCKALSDIPVTDLEAARDHIVKTARWFPTISEIRDAAQRTMGRRNAKIARARLMIRRHEEEWREPEPIITPEEFARMKRALPFEIDTGKGQAA